MAETIEFNFEQFFDFSDFPQVLLEENVVEAPRSDHVQETVFQMQNEYNTQEEANILLDNQNQKKKRKFQEISDFQTEVTQIEVSKKRNFSTPKERTDLPKRCKNRNCKHHQHYKTHQEAEFMGPLFETIKGRSTYCLCGNPIQFWNGFKWVSSATLSKK
jgi:hypothetical protein